jgi:pimeloyl-ACP methyl ester carboxylesterase
MRRSRFLTTSASVTATLGSPGVSRAAAPHTGEPLQTVPDHYAKLEAFLSFLQERNTSQYARIPAGGIYEESYVRIGGIDQWVTIHGDNQANPILLFVHGGPGDVTNPWTFVLFRSWRRHFTIVQWDQRGAGKTLGRSGPDIAPTITIDRMVQDGLELTEQVVKCVRGCR